MGTKSKFKETELGLIPENWEITQASNFCFSVTDGTHDSPKKTDSGNYLITSRHIKGNKLDFENAYFISKGDYDEVNKRSRVNQWDILFSMIGTIGESYLEINDNIDYAIKNIGLFKPGDENRAKWLYYYLKSFQAKEYIHMNTSGTTQEYVTLGALRKFPICFPQNHSEMQKIIDILYKLDQKIQINQKMNQTLEEIGQAIFKHWFVHFEFPNKEGKPYKSSGGEMVDSELDEIPKGWEIKKLGDLAAVKGRIGWKGYKKTDLREEGPYVIGAKDIKSNFLNLENANHISIEKFEESPEIILKNKDIILSKTGSNLGPVALFDESIGPATINPNVAIIKCEKIFAELLFFFLKTRRAQNYLKEFVTTSAQPAINQATIKKMEIALPKDQNFFENVEKSFVSLYSIQNQLRKVNDNLSQIRDSLLPKLMSGKIRVPLEEK